MKIKSLKHNFVMYSIRMFSTTFFGLIIFPYVARTLGAQNLGKVQFVVSIVSYFILLINLGIPTYGKREIAFVREDRKKRSILVLELMTVLGITTIVVIIMYILSFNFISYLAPYRKLLIINIVYLLLNMFNVDWFYQGIEDQEYITKRDIALKLISGLMIFYLIKEKTDYLKYAGVLVLSLAGTNILNFKNLFKYIDFNKQIIKKIKIKKHMKPVLILFTTSLATTVFSSVDSIMLRTLVSEESLGYYSLANRIGRMPMMITLAVFTVFYPRLCNLVNADNYKKYYDLGNKGLTYSLLLSVPSTVGIFALSPEIISIMGGKEFGPSINILRGFSLLVTVMTFAYFTGNNLVINRKENIFMKGQILASIGNVIFNFIFIPIFGGVGAAIGTIVAESIAIMYRLKKGKEIFKNFEIINKNKFKILISSMIMGIIIINIKNYSNIIFINFLIKTISGMIIYLIGLIILKEESIIEFIKKRRK